MAGPMCCHDARPTTQHSLAQEEAHRLLAAEQARAAHLEQRLAEAHTTNGYHGDGKVLCLIDLFCLRLSTTCCEGACAFSVCVLFSVSCVALWRLGAHIL